MVFPCPYVVRASGHAWAHAAADVEHQGLHHLEKAPRRVRGMGRGPLEHAGHFCGLHEAWRGLAFLTSAPAHKSSPCCVPAPASLLCRYASSVFMVSGWQHVGVLVWRGAWGTQRAGELCAVFGPPPTLLPLTPAGQVHRHVHGGGAQGGAAAACLLPSVCAVPTHTLACTHVYTQTHTRMHT